MSEKTPPTEERVWTLVRHGYNVIGCWKSGCCLGKYAPTLRDGEHVSVVPKDRALKAEAALREAERLRQEDRQIADEALVTQINLKHDAIDAKHKAEAERDALRA